MEFATGALGTLLPKLGQLLQDEYNLHKGVKKNIKFISRELESIQAALRHVGEVPPEQLNELVKIWMRHAREVSYDLEDIVDTFLVRVQGPEPPSKKSSKKFIKKMKDIFTMAKTRHEIGQEIKDIEERVKEVAERRDRYKIDAITPAKTLVDPRIPSLYTKVADLVGIDEAREELITRLTKGDDLSTQQRVVSVVGFGGLGKTTLAKAVYVELKGQFDCTAFVPVGRNPDLKKVFKDILIDLHEYSNLEILDERQLINKLHNFLGNKRYLIIIDDVWDTQSWGIIKLALLDSRGSRIIITTRTHEVAREAGGLYELQTLSADNSRKLFFARIFGGAKKISEHQPDEVFDKIIRKCGGIPLAIITMASLLVGKPKEEWPKLHRSIDFGNNRENQQVENTMKILSFSYYDLPSHLRTCLLHLSMFPEDHFIEKTPLIWMWIAEGFVHEKQGISLFQIGEGYFNELVNRSMIQLAEKYLSWGDMAEFGCYVHDMVMDLIRSISLEENFVTMLDNNNERASSQGKVRRIALQSNRTVEAHMEDMQQVRSFSSYGCDIDKGVPLSSFKLIRVLAIHTTTSRDIEHCHLKHLQNLPHFRFLRLSGARRISFPEEIGSLKFLQTLDVDTSWGAEVPSTVGFLTKLLCLRFRYSVNIVPDGIGKLTSLEELQIYYQGEEEEPWWRFVKELGGLRELRMLRIGMPDVQTTDVRVAQKIVVESLRNLEKLEHLSLKNMRSPVSSDTATWQTAGLVLPRHIRRLFLDWINFSRFPSFCINPSCLPNLSHLYLLVDDMDKKDLRILGRLPELRELELWVQQFSKEVVLWSTSTDAGDGDGYLFQKLTSCTIHLDLLLLPSKDDSGSVSFRMCDVRATKLSCEAPETEDVRSGKGVALTLMPSLQKLSFLVLAREFKGHISDGDCGSLGLEYFASLQNAKANIYCDGASAVEVEKVKAALCHAADVHPNRPTLEVEMRKVEKMISAAQDQEGHAL